MKLNHRILKLSALIVMIFLQSQWALAQRSHKANRGARIDIENLKTELNLSEDQVTQIKSIKEKYATKRKALREQAQGDRQQNRAAIRELMEAQREEFNNVLTSDQQAKLKALKKEKRAEMHERHKAKKEAWSKVDREAIQKELEAYQEQNIQPVMQAQRAKLEEKISTADKAEIADLRQIMAALKMEKEEMRKQIREGMKEGNKPSKEDMQKSRIEMKEKYEEALKSLRSLTEKYDADITALLTEVAPKRKQWHNDMRAIKEKHIPTELKGKQKQHSKKGRKHRGGKSETQKTMKGDRGKTKFLLMEPDAIDNQAQNALIDQIKVYPNPAVSKQYAFI